MAKGYLAEKYANPSEGHYSDLQVLRSAAGWYVGTTHYNKKGFYEPGSRESEYFRTHHDAHAALTNHTWNQRPNP